MTAPPRMDSRRAPPLGSIGRTLASVPLPRLLLLACLTLVAACASPELQEAGQVPQPPRLARAAAVMEDGYRLPLRRWGDPAQARAVALGLHGFNDHGNAFAALGDYLGERGVLTYAYDQRGFGTTAQRGLWAGEDRMIADLRTLVGLLRARHPGLPLYLIGESMGAAVVMAAAPELQGVRGIVLIAPAVWSRDTMPALQRLLLSAGVRTLPGLELTGRGLGIRPTDNDPAWRLYSADPQVIKATRIDALWGVTNLMDLATRAAPRDRPPTLVLYGEHDEIIPKRAFCSLLSALPGEPPALRLVIYPRGWHMLMRDLQGAWVMADIAAWIDDQGARLPSEKAVRADGERVKRLCRHR